MDHHATAKASDDSLTKLCAMAACLLLIGVVVYTVVTIFFPMARRAGGGCGVSAKGAAIAGSAAHDCADDADFNSRTGSGMAFVMFYAPWCGHCQNAMPEFAKAAADPRVKVPFLTADCDSKISRDLSEKFQIKGFPTFLMIENGAVVKQFSGERSAAKFAEFCAA
jgi:thiol-disulfide isomerase/thioredoxin